MSENYLLKAISTKTNGMPSTQAISLQDAALRIYKEKDGAKLEKFLKENSLWDSNLEVYVRLSFNNGADTNESDNVANHFDEVVFESLLPQFNTEPEHVFRKFLVLHDTRLSPSDCERVAKAIFAYRLNEHKTVLPFIVSEDDGELSGVIAAQMFSNPRSVRLVELYRAKSGDLLMKYFGENFEKRGGKYQRTEHHLSQLFWFYKFEGYDHQVRILLSQSRLEPGYCRLKGSLITARDAASGIGETLAVPSDVKVFYVTKWIPDDEKITFSEFKKLTAKWDHDAMARSIFGEFRHPAWFEKLVLAWLLSGEYEGFPLHFAWVSRPGCGKTKMLTAINTVFKEMPGIFNGSNSTFKDLVPAFGTAIPKEGYLARVRRIGLVDEFFTCVMRNATRASGLENVDDVGQMTCLLDHTINEVGSGRHEPIRIRSRGKIIFATNPKLHLSSMADLSVYLNTAFVSRILWYFMTKQHEDFIQHNKILKSVIKDPYPIDNRFLKVYDVATATPLNLDTKKIQAIFDRCKELVPAVAFPIYDARAPHHINCLIDGVAKYNSIIEKRPIFEIRDEDYVDAEALLTEVLATWQDTMAGINSLPVKLRKSYIPLKDRELFDAIDKSGSLTKEELRAMVPMMVEDNTLDYHLGKLAEYGLIKTHEGKIYVHWHRDVRDVKDGTKQITFS